MFISKAYTPDNEYNEFYIHIVIFITKIGRTGSLGEGFKNTESSNNHVVFAVYNSMWAYGGW